ncbi:hypothetical protein [Nannocystis bainbridge]|uniref:Uncharacterized protein n=1 Tax=Nannocystis bainbridge TaxID=2995303 RepID=A0ABT5DRI8_9BACT|nr:hypothetical protein [Nannocystis bainbridge]MDC0716209.1 hypothetical protein [Nannocystis bainbridge]
MSEKAKQLLDAWWREYEACKRGCDSLVLGEHVRDGRVHIHGDVRSDCAMVYVHPSGCVTPVVLGDHRACMAACWHVSAAEIEMWDRAKHPPPAVCIGGVDRLFTPLRGRVVVGAVEDGTAVVLLGFLGTRWAVAYCEPGRLEWITAGDRLGTLDLDVWRVMHPRPTPASPRKSSAPPPRPDPQLDRIRELHRRVRGDFGDDDPVTEIGEVVVKCLEAQVERVPCDPLRERLDFLVDLIVEAGRRGLRADPVGTKRELAEMFSRVLSRVITPAELGEALLAARELGCCFVSLHGRTWTLRLCELVDLRSELHRRLLEQSVSGFVLGRASRGVRTPPPTAQATKMQPAPTDAGPADSSAPTSATALPADWLGLITSLLLVANLFAATLEQRTNECTEFRGQAQLGHLSLKQVHDCREVERESWAAEREALGGQVDALRAELAGLRAAREAQAGREREFSGQVDALLAELAAVRDELDAADLEIDALRRRQAEASAAHERLAGCVERARDSRLAAAGTAARSDDSATRPAMAMNLGAGPAIAHTSPREPEVATNIEYNMHELGAHGPRGPPASPGCSPSRSDSPR